MSENSRDKSGEPPRRTANPSAPLPDAGRIAVTYSAVPPKGPPGKEIHPRRKLPEVPSKPPGKTEDQ